MDTTLRTVLDYLQKMQPPYPQKWTGPRFVYNLVAGLQVCAWSLNHEKLIIQSQFRYRALYQPSERVDRIVEYMRAGTDVETATHLVLLEENL